MQSACEMQYSERSIKAVALDPSNAGSWVLASLVATCKLNGVNPFNYIHQTLRAILDSHPRNQIEQLMPWTCDEASSLAA